MRVSQRPLVAGDADKEEDEFEWVTDSEEEDPEFECDSCGRVIEDTADRFHCETCDDYDLVRPDAGKTYRLGLIRVVPVDGTPDPFEVEVSSEQIQLLNYTGDRRRTKSVPKPTPTTSSSNCRRCM